MTFTQHPGCQRFDAAGWAARKASGLLSGGGVGMDPIWHVSSRSGEACGELQYPVTYLLTYGQCTDQLTSVIIIVIIIMWLVRWTLPFPRATSMPANFVLDDRRLPDQC